MSGLAQKKKIKATAASAVRPEEAATKPKPSIHAVKRPPGTVPSPSAIPVLSKKPRLDFSAGTSGLSKVGLSSGASPPRPHLDTTWLDFCKSTTVEFDSFAEQLASALKEDKANKAARLITAVFRLFMEKKVDAHKFFIEHHLVTVCSATVKEYGEKLTNLYLHKCFLNILCWMKSLSADRQELLAALAVCLAEKQASLDHYYLSTFLHDALGERVWVDKAITSRLLSLLLKPFGTQYPSKEQYAAAGLDGPYPEAVPNPTVANKFEEKDPGQIVGLALECLRKCWAADPPNKNVLRTMCNLAGIAEVRSIAAKRMDSWSQNIRLQKYALELLLFVGTNFGSALNSDHDREALSWLLKTRSFKNKQVLSVLTVALREIVTRDENNLRAAIQMIINNEFGPQQLRTPYNMPLLQVLFGFDNTKTTRIFAQELSSVVIQKEELAKHARLLTKELFARELFRSSSQRNDFNYPLFAESYLNYILEEERRSELGIGEHVVYRSATEIITMLPLVSITPQVREAANLRRNGQPLPTENQNAINKMEKDLSSYYEVVLKWLQYAKNLFMEGTEYYTAYRRYLFLEKSEYYTMMDQGPSEQDFNHASKIFGEFCFTDKHVRLIVGDTFNSLPQDDTVNLLHDLANRAISHRFGADPRPVLAFSSGPAAAALVQRLLDVCLSRTTIGELPPLFVQSIYWQSWIIVILWSCAGKPSEGFSSIYDAFAMFRFLIHCILTKQYQFPVAFEGQSEEEMGNQEKELSEREITASQLVPSCLIAQNCVRQPPDLFMSDLSCLAADCQLVSSLCECRSPDLLKLLIDKYGALKAMPAIQDLLLNNASAIEGLDTLVLCEFLVYQMATDPRHQQIGDDKLQVITSKLRSCLETDASGLLFFLARLASPQAAERLITHRSLCYLFDQSPDQGGPFFKFSLLQPIGCFDSSKTEIGRAVAQSLLFESDPVRTDAAIAFVTKTLSKDNMHMIAAAVSPLSTRSDKFILKTLIGFYERYQDMCRKFPTEWSDIEGVSRYSVRFGDDEVFMGSSSVHSILKLLCKCNEKFPERELLIQIWFAEDGICPTVTEDGGRVVEIYPETLRLSMLCAEDERITRRALKGVAGNTAVQLLASFGLTSYSATQLMAIVDQLPIEGIGKKLALQLQPFITAYRLRGATGGEAFEEALKGLVDMEMDEEVVIKEETAERVLEVVPLPTIEQLDIPLLNVMNKAEVSQMLKEITVVDSPHLFVCPTSLVRSALSTKDIALVAVDHFEGQLKFFLAHPDAFHEIMMIISSAADFYPEVKSRVASLAARLLKSSAVKHPALEGYLKKFCPAQSDQVIDEQPNKNLHQILGRISRVVAGTVEMGEDVIAQQLIEVFGGTLVGEVFIAQIPQRHSPETVLFILRRLLAAFEPKLNPALVCEFVAACCCPEITFLKQKAPLTVLARYLAEMVAREQQRNLGNAVDLVDRLITSSGFEVLGPICTRLLVIERSDQERTFRSKASLLLTDLRTKFPCMQISSTANEVTLRGPKWRMEQSDRACSGVIAIMCEYDSDDAVSYSVSYVRELIKTNPSIVVREFGVLVNQLSTLLGMDTRELREDARYRCIESIREMAVTLMPMMQTDDLKHIDTAVALLLAIFDRHAKGKGGSIETDLSKAIIYLCYSYCEHHLERGREMLEEQGKALEACCLLHPDIPTSNHLLEQIKTLSVR